LDTCATAEHARRVVALLITSAMAAGFMDISAALRPFPPPKKPDERLGVGEPGLQPDQVAAACQDIVL
jgi:hypothetical protein